MTRTIFRKAALLCTVALLGFSAGFAQNTNTNADKKKPESETLKREKKASDLDEALKELDNATDEAKRAMQDVDWENMAADLKAALKGVDVDMKKLNADLKKSLQELDVEKLRQGVETSIAKIDWDELKAELNRVAEIDLERVKNELAEANVELQNLKPKIEENLREVRQSLETAKAELSRYNLFVDDLERDGLINKKDYRIEHKDGRLLINGKPQPAGVYNKYRSFLEKNKTFTLKKKDADFKTDNE